MHLYEIQFAWFFGGATQLDYEGLASSIRQKTNRPFVSPATFIPLPPVAPPEIPRVQLQTTDNGARATIALNRADFFASTVGVELSLAQLDKFFEDVLTISEIYLSSCSVVRLGLVGRIYQEDQEPGDKIAKSLLKKTFNNLQEASVKVVERHVADKFTYNDSYQFEHGIKIDTQQKILVVTRDLNTAPDIPLSINMETIREFSRVARERLDVSYINKIMGE